MLILMLITMVLWNLDKVELLHEFNHVVVAADASSVCANVNEDRSADHLDAQDGDDTIDVLDLFAVDQVDSVAVECVDVCSERPL